LATVPPRSTFFTLDKSINHGLRSHNPVTNEAKIFVSVVETTANESLISLGKRKRSESEGHGVRISRGRESPTEPKIGSRLIVPIRVLIETDKIVIKALWDTGATFFVVSDRLVSRAEYQRVNRDHVIRVRDYAGRAGPESQSYTKPLSFSLAGRKFSEAMEIASLADNLRYEIIILN
jgi:hypothetical protein